MSELNFKKAQKPMGISVRWEEAGDDSKSKYLGDEVQGEYVELKEDVGPNNSNIYVLKLEDETLVNVWGTTLLDDCFSAGNDGDVIPVGAVVRITCLGKKQGKSGPSKQSGKGYWTFEVQFAIPSPAFKDAQKKSASKPLSKGAQLAQNGVTASTEDAEDTSEESSDEDEY